MSKLSWQGGTVMLAVLIAAATVTVGLPGRSAQRTHAAGTTALVTTCPTGLVPWPLAEVKVPVLKDLPDGGTIGVMGQSAHSFVPCSWWVDFTAQPPSSLVDQLATLRVGFGYALGGPPGPARPTPITYIDTMPSQPAIIGTIVAAPPLKASVPLAIRKAPAPRTPWPWLPGCWACLVPRRDSPPVIPVTH